MTGFARVRKAVPAGEIVLSVKSVNHRGLDMHFHLPPELDPFETRHARRGEGARRARPPAGPRRRSHRDLPGGRLAA